MTSDTSLTLPNKKHSILWWVGGFFLILIALFLFQLFGPNPGIIVSPQTTRITAPLGPDGLPDYERYILEKSREGITPENNAAVLLWQALFPGELDAKSHAAVAAELGMDQIPSVDEALEPLHSDRNRRLMASLLKQRTDERQSDAPAATPSGGEPSDAVESPAPASFTEWYAANSGYSDELMEQVARRTWTSAELPPLAKWVRDNNAPLDLIVEASDRPRYFFPSPTLLNNDREMLIEILLPHIQSIREVGRSLPARAMWHLGEGRPEDAWRDLAALHRIAALLTQGNTLVEQLVAIAMSNIACEATLTLLHQGKLTPELARKIHQELAALPNFAAMAGSLDGMERAAALDAFIRVGTGGGNELFSAISGVNDNDGGNAAFNIISVDWNLVLRETNRWYDRLVAAARLSDRPARAAALAKFDAEIQRLHAQIQSPGPFVIGVVSRQQRSKLVSAMMLGLFLPAIGAATNAEDRQNTFLDLTRVAAALAVYRAEKGAYPDSLADLVPGIVAQLPVDLYNSKPLVYKRDSDGFVLYSLGENGLNDGGSNEQLNLLGGIPINELKAPPNADAAAANPPQPTIPSKSDDMPIRARKQVFEWPKVPPPGGEM